MNTEYLHDKSNLPAYAQFALEEQRVFPANYQLICSLEIDNFRCFKSLNIPDLRRFTIIVGKNGSGKTALLESLFVAAGGSAEIYVRTNTWRGREVIGFTPDSVLPLFEDFFHKFDPSKVLRISFKDSYGQQREVRAALSPSQVISLPFDSKVSESTHSRDIEFVWTTPSGRIESKVEITRDGFRIAQPRDVFPMAFLNSITIGSAKDTADRWSALSAKNMEGSINGAVKKLFPEVEGLSVLSMGGVSTIHVAVRALDRKIPAGLLSAGVNKFIAILVAIGFAQNGVVLIDEIENGLHYKIYTPMWEAISDFAVQNNVQVFATTHSQEFLEAIAPLASKNGSDYSLLRTERQNGEVQIENFSGKEFAGAVESGFEIR